MGELSDEADQLERERDQARGETETTRGEYAILEANYHEEQSAHRRARRWAARLGFTVAVLVVLLGVTILVEW